MLSLYYYYYFNPHAKSCTLTFLKILIVRSKAVPIILIFFCLLFYPQNTPTILKDSPTILKDSPIILRKLSGDSCDCNITEASIIVFK